MTSIILRAAFQKFYWSTDEYLDPDDFIYQMTWIGTKPIIMILV